MITSLRLVIPPKMKNSANTNSRSSRTFDHGVSGAGGTPRSTFLFMESRLCSWSHILDLRTLIGAGHGGIRRVQHHEVTHNAVGPAKAILCRILPAPARAVGGDHIVLLDQLAVASVDARDVQH